MKLNIINGNIVTPDSVIENGTVCIENGKITEICECQGQCTDNIVDAKGAYIIPGIIDIHGDDLEGAISPRPSMRFPIDFALMNVDRRYAACGITTKLHALSYYDDELKDRHAGNSIEVMDALERVREELLTEHYIHVRCEIGHNMDDAFKAIETPFVRLVSVMDHAPGQGQFNDPEKYIEFHKDAYGLSGEDLEKLMKRKMDISFSDIKIQKISEVARKAQERGLLIASHDDDSPEHVELVHSLGAHISEFPINLEAAKKARELGMITSMGAPNIILGRSTSNNLSGRDAIREGAVDVLCSDYNPPSMLYSAFLLKELSILTLPEAARMVTLNAAKAIGMDDTIGSIEEGKQANLVIVHEKAGIPVVTDTLVNGELVFTTGAKL